MSLFPAAQRHSRTSLEAAARIAESAKDLRAVVYADLLRQGDDGATDEEQQHRLKMIGDTQRPRRIELVGAGKVIKSGRERPSTKGRMMTVWVVPPATRRASVRESGP